MSRKALIVREQFGLNIAVHSAVFAISKASSSSERFYREYWPWIHGAIILASVFFYLKNDA